MGVHESPNHDPTHHRRHDGAVRAGHRNLCPQQAPDQSGEIHAGAHAAVRARLDLSGAHRLRHPARRAIVDGIHRVARLRRLLPRRARLWPLDAAQGDGRAGAEQSAGGADAGRGEGHHRGAQFHPQAAQYCKAQPARLVVGLHLDGDHRDRQSRQGGAADAVRAGMAAHHAVAARRRPRPARRLPHRDARAGQGALAQRRAGGQAGHADPAGLVRAMGRRHLGDRSGRREA